jgi:hypothetical protein
MDLNRQRLFRRTIQLLLLGAKVKLNNVWYRFVRKDTVLYTHKELEILAHKDGVYEEYPGLRIRWEYKPVLFSEFIRFFANTSNKVVVNKPTPDFLAIRSCTSSKIVLNMVILAAGDALEIDEVYHKYCEHGQLLGVCAVRGAFYAEENGIYRWNGQNFNLVEYTFEDMVELLETANTITCINVKTA